MEETICKFAKKGLTPSQIGVILRDSHGIAQVKFITGSKILRILKAHGMFCSVCNCYWNFCYFRIWVMFGLASLNTLSSISTCETD